MKKVYEEIKQIAKTALYFFIVFGLMMVMKKLYLKDYDIQFSGLSQALIGALIMAKVIVLMKNIPLGHWVAGQPKIVDVMLRTLLYVVGVFIVVILEKVFEKRHVVTGFYNQLSYVFNNRDIYHVWASTMGIALAIFTYNAFSVVQQKLGKGNLARLFLSSPSAES